MKRWLLFLVLAAACDQRANIPAAAPADSAPGPAPATADTTSAGDSAGARPAGPVQPPPRAAYTGKVLVSGAEGIVQTSLQSATAGVITLSGALEAELRALAGATVAVTGAETRGDNHRAVNVESYEVVDVDGERPAVGRFLAGSRLATSADTLVVVGTINAPVGAKIWITGDRTGKQIAVRSFGVITR